MRGRQDPQVTMLAFVDLEARVPPDHPLRIIKALADQALAALSPEFNRMYAEVGRPSIPPERLLKASLLIALYSVRSERAFCEDLDYNLLFRWFLDMNLMERSFDPTVFTKNRQRLLEHRVGQQLFDEVVMEADRHGLLSDEHFTVDGTLIEAAASLKSFKRRDGDPQVTTDDDPGNPSVDFHGERRRNATHASITDPEARLMRKGKGKGSKAGFHGPRLDGKPARDAHGLPSELCHGHGGARCSAETGGPSSRTRLSPQDDGCGQELRHSGLRGGDPRARGHAPRSAEHPQTVQRHRLSDHSASRVCAEPAGAKASGRDLRVDENCRWVPAYAVSGSGPDRPGGLLGSHRLQPRADGEAAGARAGGPSGPGRVTFPRAHCARQAPIEAAGGASALPNPCLSILDPSSGRATAPTAASLRAIPR